MRLRKLLIQKAVEARVLARASVRQVLDTGGVMHFEKASEWSKDGQALQ